MTKKLSEEHREKKGPNAGKTFSAEHRAKISAALKGDNNPNYGKTFSAEHRAKLSAARKKQAPPNAGKTKKYTKLTCPYCLQEGTKTSMIKSHFNNCREKDSNYTLLTIQQWIAELKTHSV